MRQANSPKIHQITGIGNALVDILAHASDSFLDAEGIEKGMMQLVDREAASQLYSRIGTAREVSGGSVANSIAILSHLGARAAFIGKVADDQLGDIFAHDLASQGTHFSTSRLGAAAGEKTGRCISLVTPDGERSMSTYLGANGHFGSQDIDSALISNSEMVFLEGYQFDSPGGAAAYLQAARVARQSAVKVALTLSDPKCVTRNHDMILGFVRDHCDMIFCNAKELLALYPSARITLTGALEEALDAASRDVGLVVCTDGSRGAHIRSEGEAYHIPVAPVTPVDATGAGDSFAGAFLWALLEGQALETCGRIAAAVAAEIILTSGARPERDLRDLLGALGLLPEILDA